MLALALFAASCKREAPAKDHDEAPRPVAPGGVCKGTEPAVEDPAGLAFLDSIGGRLDIELTEPTEKISPNLANRKATPTATIKRVKLDAYTFTDSDLVPLTAAELDRVVFRGAVLKLVGYGDVVTHTAADCELTVRDVLEAVEKTELETRSDSDWFEGIDVHHVFFQGLSRHSAVRDVWVISWGS